jgi:hypothetical protein
MNKTTFKGLLHDDLRVVLANKITQCFPIVSGSVVSELWVVNPNVIYDVDFMVVRMDGDGLIKLLDRFEFNEVGNKYSSLRVDVSHRLWNNLHNLTLTTSEIDKILMNINPTVKDGKLANKNEAIEVVSNFKIVEKEIRKRKLIYGRFYYDFGGNIMTKEWPYIEGFEDDAWDSLRRVLKRKSKKFNQIKIKPLKDMGYTNYQI